MGRIDVFKLLEDNKNNKYCAQDIVDIIKISKSSVNRVLKIMRKLNEVRFKSIRIGKRIRYYHWYRGDEDGED